MEQILEQIKQFADQAHGDQMRKYEPARYIVHPVRVMEQTEKFTTQISVLAAALLHDVLEDTATSKEEILHFLTPLLGADAAKQTVHIVEELTDVYTRKAYPHWNRFKRKRKETERLEKSSGAAQTIKYADLMDNAGEIARQDPDFAKRYLEEARNLLRRMRKGDPELRQQAIEVIKNSFQTLDASVT